MINPSVENIAVITAERVIENIFPIIISTVDMFVETSVSIVPRSFSPAPRSIAGYIEPVKIYAMNINATKAPTKVPANSSSVVRSSSITFIGSMKSSSKFSSVSLSSLI